MKYIKLFENIREPQVGDYVICFDSLDDKISEIIENEIGKIIDIDDGDFPYIIKYKKEFPASGGANSRRFDMTEILFFSEDKEDCEDYLAAKKYNL